jgi:hypothetical protein
MSDSNKNLPKLRAEVAEKYECTIQPTQLHRVKLSYGKRVSVNLPALSLKKADELVKAGFPYLKEKSTNKNTTANK